MLRKSALQVICAVICFAALLFLIGCDDDDPVGPENTPTPTQTPTVTPTPQSSMWGFTSGRARVEVSNLTPDPIYEKESIFCLEHPTTGAWLNVRHRAGDKYQMKGALNRDYGCHGEVNYWDSQSAGNGIWLVEWEQQGLTTRTTITSPTGGTETVYMEGGAAAWRIVRHGSADVNIPAASPATVTILEVTGTPGDAIECNE
ncbi:hypothetical protein JW823_03765 [bacterium]|nr:hypothetical protein [candidate division CSSED10-310 bacterium]